MEHIKEPSGVYLVVDSTPLTKKDREQISQVIAHYKATGKKIMTKKLKAQKRKSKGISTARKEEQS